MSSDVSRAWKAKVEGEKLKQQPIPAGMVRFERHDYSYGRQGQIKLIGYTLKDVPEVEAIEWIGYGASTVTWPDGHTESFDMRVTPVEHRGHLGYGTLLQQGNQITGTLSRLPNLLIGYYGQILISAKERESFVVTIK